MCSGENVPHELTEADLSGLSTGVDLINFMMQSQVAEQLDRGGKYVLYFRKWLEHRFSNCLYNINNLQQFGTTKPDASFSLQLIC